MRTRLGSLCAVLAIISTLALISAPPTAAQSSWRDTGIRLPGSSMVLKSCFDSSRPGVLLYHDQGIGTVAYNLNDGSNTLISRQGFDACAASGLLYRIAPDANGAVVFSRTNPDGQAITPAPLVFATDGSRLVYGIRDGRVQASFDGGLTWQARTLPTPAEQIILAAASDDARALYALVVNRSGVTRGEAAYTIFFSADAGVTWETRSSARAQGDASFGGPYLRLQTFPATSAALVQLIINPGYPGSSNRQAVLLSNNGGRSFNEAGFLGLGGWLQLIGTPEGLLRMSVVGPSPTAYSFSFSADGGQTWEARSAPPGAEGPQLSAPIVHINPLAPPVPAYLFLFDANGLWFSHDNARSWELLSPPIDPRHNLSITPYLPMQIVLLLGETREVLVRDLPDAGAAQRRGATDKQLPGGVYFPETQHNLAGLFLEYWQRNGGLAQFGYPKTEPFNEVNPADGRIYRVQYFERNRFEYHPENQPPYDVLLGLLGNQMTEQRRSEAPFVHVPDPRTSGVAYFPETGHTLRGRFLEYWRARGGLAIYGYPISEEFVELNEEDGRPYRVQYFERNRFEYHPENQPPYDVLLGLLGNRLLRKKGWE